jgi:hypothetical protein
MSGSQPEPNKIGPDCSLDSTNSPLFFFEAPGDRTGLPLPPQTVEALKRIKRRLRRPDQGEPPSNPS